MLPLTAVVFVVLAMAHFIVDWLPQTHSIAVSKSTDMTSLALHSFLYSLPMSLIVCWLYTNVAYVVYVEHADVLYFHVLPVSLFLLFASHMYIDSGIPVRWWAKHIRRLPVDLEEAINTPGYFGTLTLILAIVVDQLLHLLVLVVLSMCIVGSVALNL